VSYYGSCVKDNLLWILMDFCGCGSVGDLMKNLNKESKTLSEEQIAAILSSVLNGLVYLHSQNVIHRDLKPANILLNSSGEPKIADFGVSGELSETLRRQTTIGTPVFMGPEVIEGKKYNFKADIWSLGITVIEMAQGFLPYKDEPLMRAINLLVTNPPPTVEEPDKISKDLNSFIADSLIKDPEKRKSADILLTHHFLTSKSGQDNGKVLREILSQYFTIDMKESDSDSEGSSSPLSNSSPKEIDKSTVIQQELKTTEKKLPPQKSDNEKPAVIQQELKIPEKKSGATPQELKIPEKKSPPQKSDNEKPAVIQQELKTTEKKLPPQKSDNEKPAVIQQELKIPEKKSGATPQELKTTEKKSPPQKSDNDTKRHSESMAGDVVHLKTVIVQQQEEINKLKEQLQKVTQQKEQLQRQLELLLPHGKK